MGFILGRVSFEGRPVDAAAFARAFDALRPGRCARRQPGRGGVGLWPSRHGDGWCACNPAAAGVRADRGLCLVAPLDAAYPDMGDRDERRVIAAQCAALDVPARFGASSAPDYEAMAARPMELQGTADLIDSTYLKAHRTASSLRLKKGGLDV